jgi:hypothetical protein
MKTKIKYIAITLTIIALATAVIFVACKKQNNEYPDDNNTEKYLYQSVFNNQIPTKGKTVMDEFSMDLLALDTKEVAITNIANNQVSLTIEHGNLFVNGENMDFSNNDYRLTLEDNILKLQNIANDFYVYKDLFTNEHFLCYNNQHYNILEIPEELNIDEGDEIQLFVPLMLLNEFADIPIQDINNKPQKIYQGTGVGFHLNLSDAQFFCTRDYNNILQQNPGWCSHGITYSCIFQGLFCMCTANFYSGDDC